MLPSICDAISFSCGIPRTLSGERMGEVRPRRLLQKSPATPLLSVTWITPLHYSTRLASAKSPAFRPVCPGRQLRYTPGARDNERSPRALVAAIALVFEQDDCLALYLLPRIRRPNWPSWTWSLGSAFSGWYSRRARSKYWTT